MTDSNQTDPILSTTIREIDGRPPTVLDALAALEMEARRREEADRGDTRDRRIAELEAERDSFKVEAERLREKIVRVESVCSEYDGGPVGKWGREILAAIRAALAENGEVRR